MQAKLIKMISVYKDMTLADISSRIGKSQPNFTQILKRDDLRESDMQQIADALDCDLKIEWVDRKTGKVFS